MGNRRQVVTVFGACEVYLDNPYVMIGWLESCRAVAGIWKKAPLGVNWNAMATIQESLEVGLKIVVEKSATRWVTDTRDMAVMPPEAQKWTNESWWPRALAAGFRWLAIVMPKSVVSKMAIDRSLDKNAGHETQFFGDVEEAIAWLKTKP